MIKVHVRLALPLAVLCLFAVASAPAHAMRAAIVIGNNVGRAGDEPLRFAENDAEEIAAILVKLAGFERSSTILLKGASVHEVRRVFADLSARLHQIPGEHLFFFFYSGHADAQALRLGNEAFPLVEVQRLLLDVAPGVRIAIVDACQSGALTRLKGGTPGVTFAIDEAEQRSRGLAILASASASEMAQESQDLHGSFFTHYFEAGLLGLADRNHDGQVTLTEAFDYASERTLNATVGSSAGPQHPTFRYDLNGERDVVLTRPRNQTAGYGTLVFDKPGWYFVRREHGVIVGEFVVRGNEQIALEAGSYEISRRDSDSLFVSTTALVSEGRTLVGSLPMQRIAFGRAVRKGALGRNSAFAVGMDAQLRSSVAGLGPAEGGMLFFRVDARPGSLELRGRVAHSISTTTIPATTWEGGFGIAALRAWDVGPLVLGGGLELGWAAFREAISTGDVRVSHALLACPTALAELPLYRGVFARAEVSLPVYLLRLEGQNEQAHAALEPSARFGAGIGGYF